MTIFIDPSAAPPRGVPPHQTPHGLLAVPDWVRQAVAREMARSQVGSAPEAV